MNILLMNLTRFGDLLQMQPVILGLQAQGHTVGLVCLQNFAPATKLLRGLSYVCIVPGSEFLAKLDRDWRSAVHTLDELIAQLVSQFSVDKILNTTATVSARLLSLRISLAFGGRPIEGFGLDEDGFGETGDIWTMFLQAASTERLACPMNLVDVFRAMAGVEKGAPLWGLQKPPTEYMSGAQDFLQSALAQDAAARPIASGVQMKGFVAFQLGASDVRRQWPVEHFAALGRRLWEECGLCPILLGTAAEQPLAAYYGERNSAEHGENTSSPPYINAVGRTDILLLAGILTQIRLLVTNDTGTMHLAAGLAVPVLGLFFATAQACDTGPYMQDCCCLEPALACHPCNFNNVCVSRESYLGDMCAVKSAQLCRLRISSDLVFSLISHYIEHGVWQQCVQSDVRVWRTSQDTEGFAALESLSGHGDEERSVWLSMQKYFYRRLFDASFCGEYRPSGVLPVAFLQDLASHLRQLATLLDLLEGLLLLFERKPHAEAGSRIVQISKKIQTIFEEGKYLHCFVHIWQHATQQYGGDLSVLRHFVISFRDGIRDWNKVVNEDMLRI